MANAPLSCKHCSGRGALLQNVKVFPKIYKKCSIIIFFKICFGGECLSKSLPIPTQVVPGGWSSWKEGTCKSACIEKSRGYTTKRRLCNNPSPINTDLGCEGSSVEFATCRDEKVSIELNTYR